MQYRTKHIAMACFAGISIGGHTTAFLFMLAHVGWGGYIIWYVLGFCVGVLTLKNQLAEGVRPASAPAPEAPAALPNLPAAHTGPTIRLMVSSNDPKREETA